MSERVESTVVETYTSERHFQIWSYEVGHAQLLLRSVKGERHPSRVDLLFKAVDAIDLPTSFDGLLLQRNGRDFIATGSDWAGRVTAGACFLAEDSGEYFDPSPFADSMSGA